MGFAAAGLGLGDDIAAFQDFWYHPLLDESWVCKIYPVYGRKHFIVKIKPFKSITHCFT